MLEFEITNKQLQKHWSYDFSFTIGKIYNHKDNEDAIKDTRYWNM